MFKKLSLELGGKNPTLVFGDCDFEATVKQVVTASFSIRGKSVWCGSRIFVRKVFMKIQGSICRQGKNFESG